MSCSIRLVDWSARAAGMETKEQWKRWLLNGEDIIEDAEQYRPACKELKPAIRRRITRLSRLVIDPCIEVAQNANIDIQKAGLIFASEHGEISILETLFLQIEADGQLSPIDFCNSVHHTATGYLSMGVLNRGISRTVSGGDNTFAAGLLETCTLLCTKKCTHVVLLAGDEPVPPAIGDKKGCFDFAYGMAAVFTLDNNSHNDGTVLTPSIIRSLFKNKITVAGFLKEQVSAGHIGRGNL